jgi:hypothetical protein
VSAFVPPGSNDLGLLVRSAAALVGLIFGKVFAVCGECAKVIFGTHEALARDALVDLLLDRQQVCAGSFSLRGLSFKLLGGGRNSLENPAGLMFLETVAKSGFAVIVDVIVNSFLRAGHEDGGPRQLTLNLLGGPRHAGPEKELEVRRACGGSKLPATRQEGNILAVPKFLDIGLGIVIPSAAETLVFHDHDSWSMIPSGLVICSRPLAVRGVLRALSQIARRGPVGGRVADRSFDLFFGVYYN